MLLSADRIEPESPPIDLRRLEMIAETEEEKIVFMECFFKTSEEIAAEMKKASESDDPLLWKNAAHKLRGAAANIGSVSIECLCLESERIAWTGIKFRGVLLQKIDDELSRLKSYIAEGRAALIFSGKKS